MFRSHSLKLTKKLDSNTKKNNGIFFTPKSVRKKLLEYLDVTNAKYILEPSAGSCEFILDIESKLPDYSTTYIVELNDDIANTIENLEFTTNVIFHHADFMEIDFDNKFDLIIGNPPYLVCSHYEEYMEYYDGRPNLFCMFMLKALLLLEVNGILAFIIPTSFLNSIYYNKTRKYIYDNFTLLNIIYFNSADFLETKQEVIGIIIKNSPPTSNSELCFVKNNRYIFGSKLKTTKLNELYIDSKSLIELGYIVRTGNIVWNQHKNKLTNTVGIPLIYNSNVITGNFEIKEFDNESKKQYIKNMPTIKEKSIVVNRGNGNTKYRFYYSLISIDEYCVENHLNMITGPNIEKLYDALSNEKTKKIISIITANGALSASELYTMVPIFI